MDLDHFFRLIPLIVIFLGWLVVIIRRSARAYQERIAPAMREFDARNAARTPSAQQPGASLLAQRVAAARQAPTPPAPPRAAAAPRAAPARQQPSRQEPPRRQLPVRQQYGLLSPFRSGTTLLRSIVVAEALAPPLAIRRQDPR